MSRNFLPGVALLLISFLAGGCATTATTDPRDPLEGINRSIYSFNQFMDKALFDRVGKVYTTVVPHPVNHGVTNFFNNLAEIASIANNILQLKLRAAVRNMGRFAVNSILGIGGLWDVATGYGLPRRHEDLGQTLGHWGVGNGPFLIVPFLGPTTLRDAVGYGVDTAFLNPVSYVNPDAYRAGLLSLDYIDYKTDTKSARSLVSEASVDEYEFLKNAYLERRASQVQDIEDGVLPPEVMEPESY
jgi:phospholipid-binding lipoprotein MlaA